MLDPKSLETPESWSASSRGYADHIAPRLIALYIDSIIDRMQVDEDCEVLEIAAGSGALTLPLSKRVKSLLATDFAPRMLEVLRERLRAEGIDHVSCKIMDGQQLELDDNIFDRAGCSFGLMLFPNRAKGFSELHRVLRSGGRAVVSAWSGPERFEMFSMFMQAVKQAFPELPPPAAPPSVFSLANPSAFKSEMEAAGFQEVEVEQVSRDLELESSDQCWQMMSTAAPPVRALFERLGPGGQEKVCESLTRLMEDRFGSGPIRFTNVATIGSGTVA